MLELDDLIVTVKQWRGLPTWNPLAKTVIVLMNALKTESQKDSMVHKILEVLLENGMLYTYVIYQMEQDPFKMEVETWFPYLNVSCADRIENIMKVEECVVDEKHDPVTGIYDRKATIIPSPMSSVEKLPQFYHNCPLKVSTIVWEPFIVMNSSEQIDFGLEYLMLRAITGQIQMKLEMKILDDSLAAKKITEDNKTGLYADLIQK